MAAAPALVAMASHFNAGADRQLFSQLVMTLPAAMLVLTAPIAGWLAARLGQRGILLGSLLLYVLGGAGVLLIDSRAALVAMRLILGVAGGGLLTSSLGLIGDHFSGHARERVLGYATSLSSLTAALALVFGGRLVDFGGWRAPFALYLLGLPTFALAFAVIRDAAVPQRSGRKPMSVRRELGHVWAYYALLILLTLAMFTPAVQTAFVLSDKGIASAETIGSIVAACSIVAIFSAASFGYLRSFVTLPGFLAINTLTMGSGILIIGIASQTWEIFAGCALVGIGAGMSEPAIASIIFARTAPVAHALAMGLIVSAINAGQFINPLVFAPLRNAVGAAGSFIWVGCALLMVAGFIVLNGRNQLLERN